MYQSIFFIRYLQR